MLNLAPVQRVTGRRFATIRLPSVLLFCPHPHVQHSVLVTGGPFAPDLQDALASLLVLYGEVEPENAALAVLLTPVEAHVGSTDTRDRLIGALERSGFAARAGESLPDDATRLENASASASVRPVILLLDVATGALVIVVAVLSGMLIGLGRSEQTSAAPVLTDRPPGAVASIGATPVPRIEATPLNVDGASAPQVTPRPRRAVTIPAETAGTVHVREVRTGRHPGFDRVVFEFDGDAMPGVQIGSASPSGYRCETDSWFDVGSEALSVALKRVDGSAIELDGRDVQRPLLAVRAMTTACIGGFGMDAVYVIGLDREHSFRTLVLRDPLRLVLDIQISDSQ